MLIKQKSLNTRAVTPSPGRNPRLAAGSAQTSATSVTWTNAEPNTLMERVLAPANLKRAYQRVVNNKGAPGAESHHAAIPCSGFIAVIGAVHIKTRENAFWLNPACRSWSAIRRYRPATKPQGDQHRVLEGRGLIKIVCPNGYVTEHPVFLLTKARRYRVILKVGVYSRRRVSRGRRVSALQIEGKEKPAMGSSGLKGMIARSCGKHRRPSVNGV